MAGYITYRNQGATRNRPLDDDLVKRLGYLQDMGVTMEVFSGGQPGKGEGGARVGSVRHDHGGAADAFFYKDGRKLDWSNKDDLPIFQQIVSQGKANGITGFGAGDGYMQKGSMHIGMGSPGVWGAGGKGDNAAPWLRSAYDGTPFDPSSITAVAQSSGGSSASGSASVDPAVQALQAQAVARANAPQTESAMVANPNAGKPYKDGFISWMQNRSNPDTAPKQPDMKPEGGDTERGLLEKMGVGKMPNSILGVNTKKATKAFSAFNDIIEKQNAANNQQIQAAAQAGQSRRASAPPVQIASAPSPIFDGGMGAAGGMGGQFDPQQLEELKKKLLMQRLGGLGGLGGFGRV